MVGFNTRAVVLAAGRSTRFKTKKSKLLSNICGQSMILYPLRVLESLQIPITLVLGYQAEAVLDEVASAQVREVSHVIQEEQKGTGHAVLCSEAYWDKDHILIMNGDMPLISKEVISQLLNEHISRNASVSFLTAYVIDPSGYGRIIERDGKFENVEEKDASEEQRAINRINAGVYVMRRDFLQANIGKLGKSSITGEMYLPDLIKMASDQNMIVHALSIPYDFVRGVNTLQELWGVEQIKRSEFIKFWMSRGVRFELAQSIHIDMNVEIGAGSFIGTGVHLLGNTKIGEECFVGAFTIIEDSVIGDGSNIHSHSVLQQTTVGQNVHVGPFARLRQNVTLGNDVQVGNFVEIKSSSFGDGSKAKHHSYIGDADLGANVNIGAGTITCNFDGANKNTTKIDDNVFVGSNNTIVAPVKIGEGAYTAAGSTITQDVPADALAIGRIRQINKNGYAHKLRDEIARQSDNRSNPEKMTDLVGAEDAQDEKIQFMGAVKTEADHRL